jgi:hypothetical protein
MKYQVQNQINGLLYLRDLRVNIVQSLTKRILMMKMKMNFKIKPKIQTNTMTVFITKKKISSLLKI